MEKFVISSIKAGSLQNIIRQNNPFVLNSEQTHIINWFNTIAAEKAKTNEKQIVYRAMYNILIPEEGKQRLPHPIPFSTTTSLKLAIDWLCNAPKNKCILIIYLPDKCAYLKVDNDDEFEVILPAGEIIIDRLIHVNDYIYYYNCFFQSNNSRYSFDERLDLGDEGSSSKLGEGKSSNK